MPRLNRRSTLLGGLGIAVAGGAIAAIIAVSGSGKSSPEPPQPVSTVAMNTRACLFADGSPATQQAWAGMQDYAKGGGVNIQRTVVPANAPDDDAYLNGLVQQDCHVIVAVGNGPARSADDAAAYHPGIRFVVIGSAQHRANTVVLTNQAGLSSAEISTAIRTAVR